MFRIEVGNICILENWNTCYEYKIINPSEILWNVNTINAVNELKIFHVTITHVYGLKKNDLL